MVHLSVFLLIALSQIVLAAGNVCMKKGSGSPSLPKARKRYRFGWFAGGIAAMTGWFLLWVFLMTKLPLNRLFAFEGLSPILVTAASAIFLKEEIATRAWIASGLIGIGIGLVASF